MCAFIRKFSSVLYRGADLLPNGYKIVRQSFFDDLQGEKRTCWDIEIVQDDEKGYAYEISRCLYFDTCKELICKAVHHLLQIVYYLVGMLVNIIWETINN